MQNIELETWSQTCIWLVSTILLLCLSEPRSTHYDIRGSENITFGFRTKNKPLSCWVIFSTIVYLPFIWKTSEIHVLIQNILYGISYRLLYIQRAGGGLEEPHDSWEWWMRNEDRNVTEKKKFEFSSAIINNK